MPFLSACALLAWIVGPSLNGSLYGMPISTKSAPASRKGFDDRHGVLQMWMTGGKINIELYYFYSQKQIDPDSYFV